jgi:hypothetical protein
MLLSFCFQMVVSKFKGTTTSSNQKQLSTSTNQTTYHWVFFVMTFSSMIWKVMESKSTRVHVDTNVVWFSFWKELLVSILTCKIYLEILEVGLCTPVLLISKPLNPNSNTFDQIQEPLCLVQKPCLVPCTHCTCPMQMIAQVQNFPTN